MGWVIRELIKIPNTDNPNDYKKIESFSEIMSETAAQKVFDRAVTNWRNKYREYPITIELHYADDMKVFIPTTKTLQTKRHLDKSEGDKCDTNKKYIIV